MEMPKRRKALRELFQATVAAASVISGAAQVEAQKLPPGSNTANRILSESERVHEKAKTKAPSWEATVHPSKLYTVPNREDTEMVSKYLPFLERLHGLHVQRGISFEIRPAYEEFCKELVDKMTTYCEKFADSNPDRAEQNVLTPEMFARIRGINFELNRKIKPRKDGDKDEWAIPKKPKWVGDCEDYMLAKFDELIDTGIDPEHLHILIVYDEKTEGHAVLGVDVFINNATHTLVLDNKINDIITLSEMNKKYKGELASFIQRTPEGKWVVRFSKYSTNEWPSN